MDQLEGSAYGAVETAIKTSVATKELLCQILHAENYSLLKGDVLEGSIFEDPAKAVELIKRYHVILYRYPSRTYQFTSTPAKRSIMAYNATKGVCAKVI